MEGKSESESESEKERERERKRAWIDREKGVIETEKLG